MVMRAVHALRPLFVGLSKLESRFLTDRLHSIPVDRPIYVCGIARAGTTITLDMLHHHPDVGNHFYFHMPIPYLPYWWSRFTNVVPLPVLKPVERVHKDGLLVTKDSPDAVEERLWMTFFRNLHTETVSNVIGENDNNPAFESFYRDHIKKLLLSQSRGRYITKNNYNVTRLEYLQKLFPDARFLLIVRHPVNHVASLIKQQRLFTRLSRSDPATLAAVDIVGHFEFGPDLVLINTANTEALATIRSLWKKGADAQGWARYWASVYDFLARQLEANTKLAQSCLVVRYEDLCRRSEETIDTILRHAQLSEPEFAATKARYAGRLAEPRYYRHGFSDREIDAIVTETRAAAAAFGYSL